VEKDLDINHYEVLNVSHNATQKEINRAFCKLAKEWHPDTNHNDKAKAAREYRLLSRAKEVLTSPTLKLLYDSTFTKNPNLVRHASNPINATKHNKCKDYDQEFDQVYSDPMWDSDSDTASGDSASGESASGNTWNSGGVESESFCKKVHGLDDITLFDNEMHPSAKEMKHPGKLFGLKKNSKNKYITAKNSVLPKCTKKSFDYEDHELESPFSLPNGKESPRKNSLQKSFRHLSRKVRCKKRCKKRISAFVKSISEKLNPKSRHS